LRLIAGKLICTILVSLSLFNNSTLEKIQILESDSTWSTNWPVGGIIYGIDVDPINTSIIYLSSPNGGFFRSPDGGASWNGINTGLSGLYTTEIAIHPQTTSTLYGYADYAIWKSTNSGGNWIKIQNTSSVYKIQFDPSDPTDIYVAKDQGLLRTLNGGSTWETIYPDGQWTTSIFDLEIDPQNTNVLYASLANLSAPGEWFGIYKSVDEGNTWTPVNSGITDLHIRSIAVDKQTPNQVYACSEAGKIYKSINNGSNWNEIFNRSGCFDVIAEGGIVYAANGTVSRSMDGGLTWDTKTTNFMTMELIFNAQNTNIVYAASWNGMYKTIDSGENWFTINNNLSADNITAMAVDPLVPTTIYASGWTSGLWKSTDNGNNWFNIQPNMLYITKLIADPISANTIYANGSRSIDGGFTWSYVGPSINMLDIYTLDPNNSDILYSSDSYPSRIWKSIDWAANWDEITTPLIANEWAKTITIDPLNSNLVYLATYYTARVFKSTTGGGNWSPAYNGLPPCQGLPVCSKSIQVLIADPHTSGVLYAGLDTDGIYKTINFGANWYPKNTGLTNKDIRTISIDTENPSIVYAGTYGGGVFRSMDSGESWEPYNNGLENGPSLPTTQFANETQIESETELVVTKPSMKVKGLVVNPDYTINLHASTEGGVYSINQNIVPTYQLDLNYDNGQPGSYFIGFGSKFPMMAKAELWVNGILLGEITISSTGILEFRLDTQYANPGLYSVFVKVMNRMGGGSFILDPLAENHTGGDGLTTFVIPAGIEFNESIYLPIIRR